MKFHLENPEVETETKVIEKNSDLREIILFNDDVNTFDHVIFSLIKICEHTEEQAQQCALIVHYKGKCGVKTGSYHELEPKCTALLNKGLSAEIQ